MNWQLHWQRFHKNPVGQWWVDYCAADRECRLSTQLEF